MQSSPTHAASPNSQVGGVLSSYGNDRVGNTNLEMTYLSTARATLFWSILKITEMYQSGQG